MNGIPSRRFLRYRPLQGRLIDLILHDSFSAAMAIFSRELHFTPAGTGREPEKGRSGASDSVKMNAERDGPHDR
jgi:hypothetical protein